MRRAAVTQSPEDPPMTVSQALAAHAACQIAGAQDADDAHRAADRVGGAAAKTEPTGFIVSWGVRVQVIGAGRLRRR